MTTLCESLHAFADGELGAAEAERFRDHLATCELCARELHDHMMLEALGPGSRGAPASNVRSLDEARRRLRRGLGVLSVLAVTVAAAWAIKVSLGPEASGPLASRSEPALEVAATRSLEVRLAYPGADRYRPYDVARGSERAGGEAVPLAALAALEKRGDLHGVGAGLALSGDLQRAELSLDRAGDAGDVAADRAALALAEGRAREALAALDALLERIPSHPQALFNRALALAQLGDARDAAEAFDRAAALGEPGWSDEARARATALRAGSEARGTGPGGAKGAGKVP
jgi:tetratricopeptide (TPR) repeat protein